MFLGREIKKGFWPFRVLDKQAMIDRSAELFAELKSETRPRDLVRKMSGGQRQAVAIARTRLSNAKLVLMDEPTAAISVRQVAEVLELIRRLKAQGVAVMLISHRMPDVFAVVRPHHRAAPRHQGGRQADRDDIARRNHRTDHGSDPCRIARKPARPKTASHAAMSDVVDIKEQTALQRVYREPGVLGDDRARSL